MALTNKLTAIADAIREKGNTTELLTLDAMPAAIAALEVGGGGSGDEDIQLHWEGNLDYWNKNGQWDWYFNKYGNKITTNKVSSIIEIFNYAITLKEIPFDINLNASSSGSANNAFNYCYELERIGKINNLNANSFNQMFNNCYRLRNVEFTNINLSSLHSRGSLGRMNEIFSYCYSLRKVQEDFLKEFYNTGSSSVFSSYFRDCYVLDEIVGLSPQSEKLTSNKFSDTFRYCHRLKNLIFDTQADGTPYTVQWQSQTINLYDGIGWDDKSPTSVYYPVAEGKLERMLKYNSGITADKFVSGDITYAALKNDPDWYTNNPHYSRYNHDSAVATINSLPDASAYLESSGGSNNAIVFRNDAGAGTDGGKIGNLTAEEVAVATAKGWTISYKVY